MLASSINSPTIVAAIQFEPELLNVQKNLAKAQQLSFEAASKGARLVVLPELCLSGYVIHDPKEASMTSQTSNGYQTITFQEIAKRFDCYIVFGYVELSEGNLYNSAAVVGPLGLSANFRKRNLYGSDYLWCSSSDQMPTTVLTPAGRTGVLICRDSMNSYRESSPRHKPGQKFYNKGDVDTIALLTNWGSDYGYPDSSWMDLSESTSANVIVSNRVGLERDMKYKGGCCVIDRNQKVYTYGSNFTTDAVVGGLVII